MSVPHVQHFLKATQHVVDVTDEAVPSSHLSSSHAVWMRKLYAQVGTASAPWSRYMCPQATKLLDEDCAAQPCPHLWKEGDWGPGRAATSVRLAALAALVLLVPFTPTGTMLPPRMYTGGSSIFCACRKNSNKTSWHVGFLQVH